MLLEKLILKFNQLKKDNRSEDSIIIALKEILQQYILNFIYTSKEYSHLIMYGGTALRIGYNLPRMSEDLDFQTNIKIDIIKFSDDLKKHFKSEYNIDIETKVNDSLEKEITVVFVKFDILKKFGFENIKWSILKIRVDIDYFDKTEKFIKDTMPGGKGTDLVFTIKTYPLSTLMASKTVAFLKRDARGIGDVITNVKPRDVYDMMWYMDKKIVPDLEYMKERDIIFHTFLDFRDALIKRVNNIEDKVFANDLAQFFYDINELENWLSNWRLKFVQLVESYKVYEIKDLEKVYLKVDFYTDNHHILYRFNSSNNQHILFKVIITDNWFVYNDLKINKGYRQESIVGISEKGGGDLSDLEHEYIGLFYKKIIDFLERNNYIVFQKEFETKVIRASADDLDISKQIYLDKRLLEKIDIEELL